MIYSIPSSLLLPASNLHNNPFFLFEKQFFISLRQKIMTIQRAHINAELFESPSNKGLLGYDEMIWNEAKCADFGNYLL